MSNKKEPRIAQRKDENAFSFWARQSQKTNVELGELFGVTAVSIGYWRDGSTAPHRARAVAVENVTHGLVPVSSWKVNE